MIKGLSWLQEQEFCIDTVGRRIWHQTDNLEVQCRERKIPPFEIMHANEHFEPYDTVMIIDISSRYVAYARLWSSDQANKLLEHSEFDHSITFKDSDARPPNRPLYKMTWEEEEVLRAYMSEHQPIANHYRQLPRQFNSQERLTVPFGCASTTAASTTW